MKDFGSNMADDQYNTSQSNLATGEPAATAAAAATHQQQQQPAPQQQQPQSQLVPGSNQQSQRGHYDDDPMSQDLQYLSREAPLDGGESTFGVYSQLGGQQGGQHLSSQSGGLEQDGGDEQQPQQDGGAFRFGTESPFDLSGGADGGEAQTVGRRTSGGQESSGVVASHFVHNEAALEQLAPDNVDIQRPMQQAGQVEVALVRSLRSQQTSGDEHGADLLHDKRANSSFPLKPFLVSFMVDARGGAMRGCRHSGVRVIIPPNSAPMPMRITCRYLRRERLVHPPPLMEGEACASKIMEVGPAGAKFLGPVLIEVPHFASLRGKEREIIILRSDSGEVWREHLVDSDEQLIESIIQTDSDEQQQQQDGDSQSRPRSALDGNLSSSGGDKENLNQQQQQQTRRLTRIVTNEFPQYFAIISRIRQEVHTVGPEGSTVDSQVVPRVQAIFTDGALTKRIKIGLQKGGRKQDQQQQAQQDQAQQQDGDNLDATATTPTNDNQRAQSPDGGASHQRPQSAASQQSNATKRRSRFLACFGTGKTGSADLLDSEHSSNADTSSNGDESPRQPVNEKLVERRRIIEDVSDSESTQESSPSLNSTRGADHQQNSLLLKSRKKRHVNDDGTTQTTELVPDDYYIEREPALILNVEPKTYGKRMASSSAQTDQKLPGVLSTSTRKTKKRGGGLLGGRKRNKTNLTIHCDPPAADDNKENADSSLEFGDDARHQQIRSIISDSLANEEAPKWRSCTIQTDSDSVTVNYVTIHPNDPAAAVEQNAVSTQTGASQDDGYVSGSGELKKDQHQQKDHHGSTLGKKLFSPFCASTGTKDDEDEEDERGSHDDSKAVDGDEANDELSGSETLSKRAQKKQQRAAKLAAADEKKKKQQQQKKKDKKKGAAGHQSEEDDQSHQNEKAAAIGSIELVKSVDREKAATPSAGGALQAHVDAEKPREIESTASLADQPESLPPMGGDESAADESLSTTTRSMSPTSKELKLKLKLEKQEKSKREKLEKLKQKELDEAAAKAEKLKKKAEKEAKKAQEKLEKAQQKALKKSSSSPTGSKPESPVPIDEQPTTTSFAAPASGAAKVGQSVKFASELVESRQATDPLNAQLQQAEYDLKPSDHHDYQNDQHRLEAKVDGVPTTTSEISETARIVGGGDNSEAPTSMVQQQQQQTQLKPILKQSSSSFDDEQQPQTAEIVIGEPEKSLSLSSVASKLVDEATAEAVRVADELKAKERSLAEQASSSIDSPTLTSSLSESKKETAKRLKAEKEKLKREAKAKLEEEKRLANETRARLKEVEMEIKRAEAEARRTAEEAEKACKLAEIQAKKAAEEAKRATEEAKRAAEIELTITGAADVGHLLSTNDNDNDEQQLQSTSSASVETSMKQLAEETKKAKKLADLEAKKLAKAAKAESKQRIEEAKKKLKSDKKNKKKEEKRGESAIEDPQQQQKETSTTSSSSSSSSSSRLPSAPSFDLSSEQQQKDSTAGDEQEPIKVGNLQAKLGEAKLGGDDDGEQQRQLATSVEATIDPRQAESIELEISGGGLQAKLGDQKAEEEGKLGASVAPVKLGSLQATDIDGDKSDNAKQKKQKQKKEKKLKDKAQKSADNSKTTTSITTTTSEQLTAAAADDDDQQKQHDPTSTASSSKSSFLSRLFGNKGGKSRAAKPKKNKKKSKQGETEVDEDETKTRAKRELADGGDDRKPAAGEQMLIVSEMYPSDPNDVDGEMILEVNVPQNLIQKEIVSQKQQQKQFSAPLRPQQQPQTLDSITVTTTTTTASKQPLDSSQAAIQTLTNATTTTTTNHLDDDDQEATLVNISQMVDHEAANDDDDEDEATENVLSQANDLVQEDILGQVEATNQDAADLIRRESKSSNKSPVVVAAAISQLPAEQQPQLDDMGKQSTIVIDDEHTPATTVVKSSTSSASSPKQATSGSSSGELQDAKKQKELEAKLVKVEKEAKKRAKEEEALRKKQEKEEKKLAELEAKKKLVEEKERLKREAQEAKRLAKLAKKQAEEDKKKAKEEAKRQLKKLKSTKVTTEGVVVGANVDQQPQQSTSESKSVAAVGAPADLNSTTKIVEHTEEPDYSRTITTVETTNSQEQEQAKQHSSDDFDLNRMSPVNEETETEKIIEEVVGEDGTITKTTKVVETKYVTMRQEELRLGERREIPLEEWQQIQQEEESKHRHRHSSSSTSSSSSSKLNEEPRIAIKVLHSSSSVSQPKVLAYQNDELETLRAIPSYFGLDRPDGVKENLSPKKEMKRRVKLNERLVARANKLAKSEYKLAKKESDKARAEIVVCDEAARQAQKEAKRALKEAKRASKLAQKEHKKMDKIDKKLSKEAKKLDKRQKKLDKQQAKLEKKESIKREKLAKKQAKDEEKARKSSGSASGGSSSGGTLRRSIKAEDIGEPILRSSSRLSIGQQQLTNTITNEQQQQHNLNRQSSIGDEVEVPVDLSLDENQLQQQREQLQQQLESLEAAAPTSEMVLTRTITTMNADGQLEERTVVLRGREAEEAAMKSELLAAREEDDEMIDVVGDGDDDEADDQIGADEQQPKEAQVASPDENSGGGSGKKSKKNKKRQVAE